MESKIKVNKHLKNSEIDSFETWHIKKTTQIGLWSHCRCYVGQCFCYFDRFRTLVQFPPSILKLCTQHLPYLFKLSTQNQPAITRVENWANLLTKGLQFSYKLIRAFSKISGYTKTVQLYSTKNTSMKNRKARRHIWCWVEFHPHHCLRGDYGMAWWNETIPSVAQTYEDFKTLSSMTCLVSPLGVVQYTGHITKTVAYDKRCCNNLLSVRRAFHNTTGPFCSKYIDKM